MDTTTDFATRLDRHLARISRDRGRLGTPQVAVRAPGLDIDYRFGDATLPFHAASVGKLVTAALVMQLCEADALRPGTLVAEVLPAAELDGLFLPGEQVTLEHLLTHTSGAADYFDGKVSSGLRVSTQAVTDPDRFWTPEDLLAVSRERQRPVGRPGQRFHYSDTGYVLLGRVLEVVTGDTFHDLVHQRVLTPLGLGRTFLPFRSSPARGSTDLAPMYLGRTEICRFRSLTCDWAGGGIASTPDDLLLLSAALHDGGLIAPESLAFLARPRHRFRPGLDYGAGVMTVRFEGFAPWLRGQPRLQGHIGVTATHLFHDPAHGAEIALNFASTREMTRSFRTLFEVVRLLGRAAS